MTTPLSLLFLGTGASRGIPIVGCSCSVCTSSNPLNQRLRTSALLQVGEKKILIDAGPDTRMQLLKHKVDKIDGLILTHTHFDHVAGLDELRALTFRPAKPIPCLLSSSSFSQLQRSHHYLFSKNEAQAETVVQLDWHPFEEDLLETTFVGVPLKVFAYHHAGMHVIGVRVGNLAYVTDIKHYKESIFEPLKGVEKLVLDSIRPGKSNAHFCFDEAIAFAERVGAKETYFTHLDHDVDVETHTSLLPDSIKLAYDGLKI